MPALIPPPGGARGALGPTAGWTTIAAVAPQARSSAPTAGWATWPVVTARSSEATAGWSATTGTATANGTAGPTAGWSVIPTVLSVDPSHGPAAGGTTVTLTGTRFTGATAVTFDGIPGVDLTVVSDTEVTVTTPAHAAGVVDVLVVTPIGTSNPATFTYDADALTVTSATPNYGPPGGGTPVTLTGTGFTSVNSVKVDSTSVSFVPVSDTQITFTTPPHLIGPATITVRTPDPASASTPFTFANPCTVTAVSPASGSTLGGTRVTVTGTGFTDATEVAFDGTPGTGLVIVSDTELEVTAPAHSAGTVHVRVTTPRDTSPINDPADNFEFRAAPHITSIDPSTGPTGGGTTVTLTGTDLDDVTVISIDGASVPFTIVDPTTITFVTPAHAAGPVWPAAADATGATASPPEPFVYFAALAVTAVAPPVGGVAGGQTVTVTGSGFLDATAVEFDTGNPATSFEVVSDTEITAVTPAHALGPVHVRVTNPRGASAATTADLFTYVAAPTVASIDPTSGTAVGGTTITITGTGFTGATAVTFDGAPGLSLTVVDDSTITVNTPTSDALGEVPVVVITPGGASTDDITYEYTNAAPTCEATATPSSGVAILTVAFNGTAADADDGLPDTVLWDFGDGATSDVAAPTHSYTTPGVYTATFTVTDRFGATASTSIEITVSARADNLAPVATATANVASGAAPLDVNFNGAASYDPDGTIVQYVWNFGDGGTAYTPLATHRYTAPGVYNATLTVMDNNGRTTTSSFITITVDPPEALEPPVITSIRPTVGTRGTPVVIHGLNLLGVDRCEFVPVGDTSGPIAEIVHVANDNYMTVIAPSGSGLVNVRVSNADYTSVVGAQTLFRYIPAPSAVATATPDEGCAPMTVQFSSAGSTSPNGGPLKYLWHFGDGGILDLGDLDTSTEANPAHTYWAGDAYLATLTITDRAGATATTIVPVITSRCPPSEGGGGAGGGGTWPPGSGGGGPGGPGGGEDPGPEGPSDPWQYGFDCSLRSGHTTRKFTFRNASYPVTPEILDTPLFSARWSARHLRNGIEFVVTVTVLRDFPKSTPPGRDYPYPTSVFFGAVAMTAEPGGPALTSANVGFGTSARLLEASGISLTPRTVGGVFRPTINTDPGEEGIFAGQTFSMAVVAPPFLEIGYAQVGFQSQYGRAVGDVAAAWVAVDCDIEDVLGTNQWTVSDPGYSGGAWVASGPNSDFAPQRLRSHRRSGQ